LSFRDLFGNVLDLEQQFHTLDGGNGGFGNSSGNTTGGEILKESCDFWEIQIRTSRENPMNL
jgi:hypothetical protein